MNIESRTDGTRGVRTHIVRGDIALADIKTFLEALYGAEGFDPGIHALWDLREAQFPGVAPADIKDLAFFARVNWAEKHQRKTAVVISVDFHFGLSRMLEQFIGPAAVGRFRTFRDLQLAFDWIDGKEGGASSSATRGPNSASPI